MKHRAVGFARPRFWSRLPGLLAIAAALALAACGGGGGGGGSNKAPTASFTVSPSTGTAPLLVTVNGSASSDPDGTISSYTWNFGDGSSGSGVSTTHTYTAGGNYALTLTVTDNKGKKGSHSQTLNIASGPPPTSVTVSGRITYDRVPFKVYPDLGLDYSPTRIAATPARGIVVELIKTSDQSILFSTNTDSSGNYSFGSAPVNTDVKVRAKAQSVSTSPAAWNIQVKNNTNSNALYVMDSGSFNTGIVNQTKDLDADSGAAGFSGGGTTAYSAPRVAAPFAILDSLYSAVQFVVSQGGNPTIVLPPLDVYWSPSNKSATGNPAIGEITTTSFQSAAGSGFLRGIYVLGDDGHDTDEYDEHVLTHEFQHYLQDVTSRDDTVGGDHARGELLDLRVAFSEGYANAFSGMSLNGDPLYRDSSGSAQSSEQVRFNLESDTAGTAGWYNESTIGQLAWDLYDSTQDGSDQVSLPYSSIATVFRNQLRTDQPLTSIFPLIVALKAANPGAAAAIDTLVGSNGMVAATMNAFGSTETNNGGSNDALPIYSNIALNGSAVTVCGDHAGGLYNKLGNRRFLKFTLNATVNATIHAQYTPTGSDAPGATTVASDPDIVLFKGPFLAIAEGSTANQEDLVRTLDPGNYVIEVYEYSHIEAPASGTSRGRTCFNVTVMSN